MAAPPCSIRAGELQCSRLAGRDGEGLADAGVLAEFAGLAEACGELGLGGALCPLSTSAPTLARTTRPATAAVSRMPRNGSRRERRGRAGGGRAACDGAGRGGGGD